MMSPFPCSIIIPLTLHALASHYLGFRQSFLCLCLVFVNQRLPAELQKKVSLLLISPAEQLQVLSSAVLRETTVEFDYIQENINPLNSHAAALLLSQVRLNSPYLH